MRRFKILLVDDSPELLMAMKHYITSWGYRVLCADSGERALEILGKIHGPVMVFLDWNLPGMDGPEVCREIRKRFSLAFVVMFTGLRSRDKEAEALNAGADDFITKPVSFERFELVLRAKIEVAKRSLAEKHPAVYDMLTHALTRNEIRTRLELELRDAERESRFLVVMFIDLDNLKQINDLSEDKHTAGDEALVAVVEALKGVLRSYDMIGRYGGDEFIVILPEDQRVKTIEGARQIALTKAEKIREAVASRKLLINGSHPKEKKVKLSVSVGVLLCVPGQGVTLEEVINAADQAVYEAKRSGRNRVVFREFHPVS